MVRAILTPGEKINRLTLISEAKPRGGSRRVLCKCECGNVTVIRMSAWMLGGTKSCGCLRRENTQRHGVSKVPAYQNWLKMMARCYDPKHESYPSYGARGIKVCQRWHDVGNFVADMGVNLAGLTLDRNDNNLDYSKSNCKWATKYEQGRNKRKYASNKTGIAGVGHYFDKRCGEYWMAHWTDSGRVHRSKSFYVKKYGEAEAFRLACETREAALKENGYSDKHGK
jgi:hypothetical protein